MRHLRLTVVIVILLISSITIMAQDDGGDGCDINLTSAASLIVQAQAEASSGQRDDALRTIELVQSVLADAVARCGGEGVDMPGEVVLGGSFRSPNGSFSFNYPAAWVTQVADTFDNGGIVYIGSNTPTLRALTQGDPVLTSGQQGAAIGIGSADEINFSADEDASLDDLLQSFVDDLQNDGDVVAGEVTRFSVNDVPAGGFDFTASGFEGILLIVDRSDIGLYGLVLGASAPGELEALRPTIMAIAESIGYDE